MATRSAPRIRQDICRKFGIDSHPTVCTDRTHDANGAARIEKGIQHESNFAARDGCVGVRRFGAGRFRAGCRCRPGLARSYAVSDVVPGPTHPGYCCWGLGQRCLPRMALFLARRPPCATRPGCTGTDRLLGHIPPVPVLTARSIVGPVEQLRFRGASTCDQRYRLASWVWCCAPLLGLVSVVCRGRSCTSN